MIFGRVISCHHFFPLGDIDLICGMWVHSDQLQIKFTFRSGPMIFGILQIWHTHLWHQHISEMTSSFFFISHDIYIYDSSVFQTWQQHLWHQCFSDITAIFMTSVFFPDMTSTLMTSVYFSHDIYIHDISVFQTFQQHLWHQCYSDMTSTFMTSVVFF